MITYLTRFTKNVLFINALTKVRYQTTLSRMNSKVPSGPIFRSSTSVSSFSNISNNAVDFPPSPVSQEKIVHPDNYISEAFYKKISTLDPVQDELSSFFICDLGELKRLIKLWRTHLPFISPYYAIKCNPTPAFVKTIADLGLGFDCASKNEIKHALSHGIDPSKVIFANPCKAISHVRYAEQNNINLTTVDNIDEVLKIREHHPSCDVLVRITTDDSSSTCPLSVKFGADINECKKIINKCLEIGVNCRGVAFHVGSGFKDPNTLKKAIFDSSEIFNYAEFKGKKFNILDVGGGFSKDNFEINAKVLRDEIFSKFGGSLENGDLSVISELGRFLAGSCFTLAVNIFAMRKEGSRARIYVNDGLYGNLNCILFDHQEVEPLVLTSKGNFKFNQEGSSEKEYSIWGPTCDGLDCIKVRYKLDHQVDVGDWLYFRNIGAYTNAAATSFNGFEANAECIFVDSEI